MIVIDLPKEFEGEYKKDCFEEFFERVMVAMSECVICGNYEMETARMLKEEFYNSMYIDVEMKDLLRGHSV